MRVQLHFSKLLYNKSKILEEFWNRSIRLTIVWPFHLVNIIASKTWHILHICSIFFRELCHGMENATRFPLLIISPRKQTLFIALHWIAPRGGNTLWKTTRACVVLELNDGSNFVWARLPHVVYCNTDVTVTSRLRKHVFETFRANIQKKNISLFIFNDFI